mgnify:CR=1 FL=1
MKATRHSTPPPPDTIMLEMSLEEVAVLKFLALRNSVIPEALKKAGYKDDLVRRVYNWQECVQQALLTIDAPSLYNAPSL